MKLTMIISPQHTSLLIFLDRQISSAICPHVYGCGTIHCSVESGHILNDGSPSTINFP